MDCYKMQVRRVGEQVEQKEDQAGKERQSKDERSSEHPTQEVHGIDEHKEEHRINEKKETGSIKKRAVFWKGAVTLKYRLIGAVATVFLALAVYAAASLAGLIPQKEGRVTTISRASLEEILEISELSTVDYIYNAIAKAYDEDGQTVRYYVAYEGRVTAGIDFEKIRIDKVDEEKKEIVITLPEVEVHDLIVDAGTMEYIFTKSRYETETVSQEAYKICLDDMEKRIKEETALYEMAKENGIAAVEGLIEPWVKELDDEYTVIVK